MTESTPAVPASEPPHRTPGPRLLRDEWRDVHDAIRVRSVGVSMPEPDKGQAKTYVHLLADGQPDDAGHMFLFTPGALVSLYVQALRAVGRLNVDPNKLRALIGDVEREAERL